MKEALSTYAERFGGNWSSQLRWIDHRLGELWSLRGPYPGLGSVLSAMGVEHGYQLAHYCWEKAGENADPWPVLTSLVRDPKELSGDLLAQVADSEVQPAGIPICIRPPFQGEAGHHSDHYPATPRGLKAFQVSN